MKFPTKRTLSCLGAAFVMTLSGCNAPTGSSTSAIQPTPTPVQTTVPATSPVPNATSASFAVLSDLHYYDPNLGTTSTAFQAYVAGDRKMVAQSQDLFNAAVADIEAQKPGFVLIPGDLTKDGELQDHQEVAATLESLKSHGIQAYVICGNHDINNPAALSYLSATPTAVPNLSPAQFKTLYADFGYSTALAQDPSSLSYVVEPVKGLWLIAIDSCEYANNSTNTDPATGAPAPVTNGQISSATLTWVLAQLSAAKAQGKTVIGMMHHGLLEHFTGESTLFSAYVDSNWKSDSQTLSNAGLNLVFTGHFHANNVVLKSFSPSSVLYDIETGSLVTSPCPYRYVTMDLTKSKVTVTTSRVTSIAHLPAGYTDFPTFAQNFLYNGLAGSSGLVTQMLTAPTSAGGMGLPASTASAITPLVAFAMMAHYYGDASSLANTVSSALVTPVPVSASASYPLAVVAGSVWGTVSTGTDSQSQYLASLINNVWKDLPPPDNNLTFTLNTTTYTSP